MGYAPQSDWTECCCKAVFVSVPGLPDTKLCGDVGGERMPGCTRNEQSGPGEVVCRRRFGGSLCCRPERTVSLNPADSMSRARSASHEEALSTRGSHHAMAEVDSLRSVL